MKWRAVKRDEIKPVDLYELARTHKLLPRNISGAVPNYKAMAAIATWYDVVDENDDAVAIFILTTVEHEEAQIDFVPYPQHFATGAFKEPLAESMIPILAELFESKKIRRVSSEVPESRGRTKKALKALGFKSEGKKRRGVQYFGKDVEDLFSLGLIPEEMKEI